MGTATIASGPWRNSVPIKLMGTDSDNLVEETGIATWSGGTVDSDELALSYVGEVLSASFTPKIAAGSADPPMGTDGTITTGAITVGRTAHADGASSYYYRILGKPVLTT
jgi:hypothetical protein